MSTTDRRDVLRDGLLGVAVGAVSGFFGVGGGIVMVPVLVVLYGYSQKRSNATSLLAIVLMAVAGTVSYAVADQVRWLAAACLAVGGLLGARAGAAVVRRVSERVMRWVFVVAMTATAVAMLFAPDASGSDGMGAALAQVGVYAAGGLAAGGLSALLGVGGGVVMVPVLALAGGFSQHEAEASALAAMVVIAATGAFEHSRSGYVHFGRGLRLGAGGVLGVPLGAAGALALPADTLQRWFAVLMLAVVLYVVLSGERRRASDPSPS